MKDEYIDYAGDYAITKTDRIGIIEYFLGEKQQDHHTEYVVGTVDRHQEAFGITSYNIDEKFNDYVDAIEFFHQMLIEEIQQLKEEIQKEPNETITKEDCYSIYMYNSLVNKVIVLNSNVLYPEYRRSCYQLFLARGGFGCRPEGSGNAIFAVNLYTGKECRIEKYDVLGVIKDEKMPDWATKNLKEINKKKSKGVER